MAIKYGLQGYLIYAAIGCYLLAAVSCLLKRRTAGQSLYALGFAVASAAFVYRWLQVQHIPFQNLFEVFLSMGMVVFPLSMFCRRGLRVGGETADMIIGAVILFPAGFVFSADPQQLPPALQCWLFAPHVGVYLLAYVIMAKATVQAIGQLASPYHASARSRYVDLERSTYEMVRLGFPFLTLGLVLGSWWGKLAWGDYWGWDPKELWSLASWLAYIGYYHFRYMFGHKHARINSIWVICGMVLVLITLLWANLSRLFSGLHSYAS